MKIKVKIRNVDALSENIKIKNTKGARSDVWKGVGGWVNISVVKS